MNLYSFLCPGFDVPVLMLYVDVDVVKFVTHSLFTKLLLGSFRIIRIRLFTEKKKHGQCHVTRNLCHETFSVSSSHKKFSSIKPYSTKTPYSPEIA